MIFFWRITRILYLILLYENIYRVRLIAKLFIVMGVLWSFEFLSWAASMAFPDSGEILIWLFMPTEIINSLQGIAIFVIFICKPNVLNRLSAKFGSLRCRQ